MRRPQSPEYLERHRRVRRIKGRADAHDCVDCGKRARDWSQRKDTDGESPEDYDPRCRSCHNKYDGIVGPVSKGSEAPWVSRANQNRIGTHYRGKS